MWTWVAETVTGVPIGELTEARDRKMIFDLRGPATCTFTLDGRADQSRWLTELHNDLLLWRDKTKMLRGRLGSTDDDLDADTHSGAWSAIDYRGFFDARIVEADQLYDQQSQDDIGWDLIHRVGYGNELGITRGDTRAAPTVRTLAVEADAAVSSTVNEMGSWWNGFDWWIDPDLRYQSQTWRGQDRPGFPIAWDSSAVKMKRSLDTSKYANWVRVRGGKPDDSAADDPNLHADRWVQPWGPPEEGRIARVVNNSELKDQAAIDAAADQLLADSLNVQAAYTATLAAGIWEGPETLWLGDTVPVVIRSGRLDVVATGRVAQLAISLSDEGEETVEVTFGTGS